ncbi:hypothetical protein N752_13990 [Desulforamulus aquiferis]|nr:hypothetical protein N752_13990 [Desulforamulus aquiferis]
MQQLIWQNIIRSNTGSLIYPAGGHYINCLIGDSKIELPEPTESDLDDYEASANTAAAVWVPNRNGLFVNIGACFAESLGCELVVAGFNREEQLPS